MTLLKYTDGQANIQMSGKTLPAWKR